MVMMEKGSVRGARAAVLMALRGRAGWVVALAAFWACALRNLELPGLYMDAINPDYLVARWLHPALHNPVWVLPGQALPILGNLYHGMQTLYMGLLTYSVLGTTVASARLTHALFGAIIVLISWLILRRATGRPLLALALAVGLASDMAFLGSFRTQAYIILAGQIWMMSGMYLAVRATRAGASAWTSMLCGVSMGLAAYGYFVFLFFLPPIALLTIFGAGRDGAKRRVLAWGVGFIIGMMPYVIGYAQLAVSVGGLTPFMEWMRNALAGLHPTGASPTYLSGLGSAFTNAKLGLSGVGNELMMFGETVSPDQVMVRPVLLVLATLGCLAGAWLQRRRDPSMARVALACAALPVSYTLCAGWFGARMWSHHFTVLVAVGYLLAGVALHAVATGFAPQLTATRVAGWAARVTGAVALVVLLAFNLVQQQRVQNRLVETGGTGMSTDALPALARAALAGRGDVVWFFPEWGFFMPFMFLTGNQVPYQLDLTSASLERQRGKYGQVRVAFWKEAEQANYAKFLAEHDVKNIRLYIMERRDGQPAFYVLSGQLGGAEGKGQGQ
jgi:hypothetical protein